MRRVGGNDAPPALPPKRRHVGKTRTNEPVNMWKDFPAKTCLQCEQSTHQLDRYFVRVGKPRYLKWVKTDMNSQGLRYPSGTECYECFDIRRMRWKQISRQALKERRTKDTEVDAAFEDMRLDKASGIMAWAGEEQRDAFAFQTVSGKQSYGDSYNEGIFQELWSWAAQRGVTNFDKKTSEGRAGLIEYIERKHPNYIVKVDSSGTEGVLMMDSIPGGYRVKMGVKEFEGLTTSERHENQDAAGEVYENRANDQSLQCNMGLASSSCSTTNDAPAKPASCEGSEVEAPVSGDVEEDHLQGGGIFSPRTATSYCRICVATKHCGGSLKTIT